MEIICRQLIYVSLGHQKLRLHIRERILQLESPVVGNIKHELAKRFSQNIETWEFVLENIIFSP